VINIRKTIADGGWELRGACRELINFIKHEVVLSGPRDTGKTIACCIKAHLYAMMYAMCQGAIVRKTNASLPGTVLQTFQRVIQGSNVTVYGGERPERFIYPNGSQIWCAGMDNPAKALSSERDFVYVNQAEELTEADWETLAGCCSGRGAVVAHPQLFGDCNPAGSKHWIKERAKRNQLKLLVAQHKDNPQLYTATGELTEGGKKRLAVLQAYTGIRKKRLFEGVWATAEGAIYDMFDVRIHAKKRDPKEFKRFYLAMDRGYTDPAVILVIGTDDDHRWHIFREFYHSGIIENQQAELGKKLFSNPFYTPERWENERWGKETPETDCITIGQQCDLIAVDSAAASLIAALNDWGTTVIGGTGKILDGIYPLQSRLLEAGDGKPRLTVDPSCVDTVNEFESYVWKQDRAKEVPEDKDNHSMDCLRYLHNVLGEPTGAFANADGIWTGDKSKIDALSFGEDVGILMPGRLGPEDY
jgi:phage terminase large subunit